MAAGLRVAALGSTGLAPSCARACGPFQVELLEQERALVVDLETGQARPLPRQALPRGAREGDVVVDGRLDPALRARQAAELRALRARLAVPVPVGLDLAAPDGLRLNSRRER